VRAKTHSGHDHDHGYKRLFSHPEAVEELIRGFLPPDWAEGLDLSTLERVPNDFVSDGLRARQSDVIWRMRRKGEEQEWLYLLLELQSTSHPFMALRMLTYAGLLLEEVLRKERLRAGSRLPTVLPVVFHNGRRPWRAPLDLEALFAESQESLRYHLPRLRYLVLDEGRLDLDRPELARNWPAALFRIETCAEPSDLPRLMPALARLLPPGEELRHTLRIWLRAVLRRIFPGVTIPEMTDLEDASMLEDTVREWRKKERREARKEGVEEGRQEGMRELLLQMIERRFGPLAEEKRRRVEAITSPARLKRMADKILTAGSLDEMEL
jgi:predicted transposase/invertase (TIGR01784 family)